MGVMTRRRLDRLDVLCDFRNAVSHGNESQVGAIMAAKPIAPTLSCYRDYRKAIDRLAGTIDAVVSEQLHLLLGIPRRW